MSNLSAARWCRVKDSGLHLAGQSRINREDDQLWNIWTQRLHTLIQDLAGRVDLFLSGQEHQDVAWTEDGGGRQTSGMETRWPWGGVSLTWRFRQVDLHDRDQTGVQVVRLGFSGVQDLHGERSSRDGENGSFKEVLGELDSVQRGGRHDQLHVFTFLDGLKETRQTFAGAGSGQLMGLRREPSHLLQEAEEHVGVDGPLVGFVQHDEGILAHVGVYQTFPLQHSVGHVLDHRLGTGAVLKANGVAHLTNPTFTH